MEAKELEHIEQVIANTEMVRDRKINSIDIMQFFSCINLEETLKSEDKVLEVGCGNGHILYGMSAKYGILPYGLDLADFLETPTNFSDKYRYPYTPLNIVFKKGSATEIPWGNNTFDFAFSYMTMIYVPDKLKALKEIHRVIKLGGKALVSIAENNNWKSILPDLSAIIREYPSGGQVEVAMFGNKYNKPFEMGALITKKSEDELVFPALKSWKYETITIPKIISNYAAGK